MTLKKVFERYVRIVPSATRIDVPGGLILINCMCFISNTQRCLGFIPTLKGKSFVSWRLDGQTAESLTVKFQMKESFSLYPLPFRRRDLCHTFENIYKKKILKYSEMIINHQRTSLVIQLLFKFSKDKSQNYDPIIIIVHHQQQQVTWITNSVFLLRALPLLCP